MRKNPVAAFIFVLWVSTLVSAQSHSIEDHVTVFSSSGVSQTVSKQRVVSCLQQLAHEWQLSENDLPNIVVFNASPKDAAAAYVFTKVSIRGNRFEEARTQ